MAKFSASKSSYGKVSYKGYEEVQADSMQVVSELAKDHSLTSYIYGPGTTDNGEQCEGHRAWASAVDAGDTMFLDFDMKGATFEILVAAMQGKSAWVGPSKSWSPTTHKFHCAVQFDRDLPMDKSAYKSLYEATIQYLGLVGMDDPCMSGASQQIAPHWSPKDHPDWFEDGAPLDMAEVMAAYVPAAEEESVGGDGGGIDGDIDSGAIFTLTKTGEQVDIRTMLGMVADGGKVRVHCLSGLLHDGRHDTALVRGDGAGGAFYHCSGGRCGHTLRVVNPEPFEVDDEDEEEASIIDIIRSSRMGAAFASRASKSLREAAVAYGAAQLCADMRIINDSVHRFDGVVWVKTWPDDNEMCRWISGLFVTCGWVTLANSISSITAVKKFILSTVRMAEESVGNSLNFPNGTLDLTTAVFREHRAEDMHTHVLPFDFNATAKAPVWEAMIDKIMLNDSDLVAALQRACGYLFAQGVYLEKMIGFVGEGSNGKSTVIEVLTRLAGEQNISSVPLHTATKSTAEGMYARAAMAGKIINFCQEMSPVALSSTEFKDLISGVRVQARNPYGRMMTIDRAPKQLAAMNSTKGLIREHTHGFQRRLHLIPFNYRVEEKDYDPLLMTKLEAEMAGIMNWVLEGTRLIFADRTLTKTARMAAMQANIVRDSDPVQQFFEEFCESYTEDFMDVHPRENLEQLVTPVSKLYLAYKNFCEENTYKPIGRNEFSKELERVGGLKVNLSFKIKGEVKKLYGFYLRVLNTNERKEPNTGVTLELVK